MSNGAQVVSNTLGQGNAGNIQVNAADSVSVSGGSGLLVPTLGQGNAGNVTINAGGVVSFDGVGAGLPSGINSEVLSAQGSVGNGLGGSINITAGSLSLTNGARLSSSTSGQGNAGNVTINARDTVSFDSSSAASNVGFTGVGKGGNINIQARSLSLSNGAFFITSTLWTGRCRKHICAG